jgi:L-asparaginase II
VPAHSVPQHVPLAITTRVDEAGKPTLESVHYGSIVVTGPDGSLLYATGDPEAITFTRSSLKPFQAMPFIAEGGHERYGFTPSQIALMCASHSGEPMHTEQVDAMLERIGCKVEHLQCGCHIPTYYATVGAKVPDGARFTALHHNCSGKHTGMLAWCRLHGERVGDYLAQAHPLQRAIRASVAHHAGLPENGLPAGIDGCSAPNYAMPLSRLAWAFAGLACPEPDPRYGSARQAVFDAMTAHPEMVSGTRRNDLALMRTGQGRWVSKVGAEGVQGLGIRDNCWGIAIKIADGNTRALYPVTVAALQQLGLLGDPGPTPLADYDHPRIENYRGKATGRVEPIFELRKL